MTFDQEIHPRIVFSSNPLKVVVAQIKFPAMFGLTEPAALAAFQAALGHRYPNAPAADPECNGDGWPRRGGGHYD
ncbi:MAG: hypothetical protein WKF78_06350 [Candidatus Limnocylindrales bacterium]